MANLDAPRGFQPVNRLGGDSRGHQRRYKKEAAVILAVGDPVVLTGDATAAGVALVTRASGASGTITGVVTGIEFNANDLYTADYLASGTSAFVYVNDDPSSLFLLQEDSDTSNVAATDVGRGADIIVANADSTFHRSAVELDSSTVGQAQVQILELAQMPDNDIGTNAKWIVRINEHTFNATATLI